MPISVKILNNNKNEIDNSFDYWNNESIEKNKLFYKLTDDFDKLKNDFKQNILSDEIINIIKKHKINLKNKNILSIASGVCYVEARTLKDVNFNKLTCIDFSNHRITKLAPFVFHNFQLENKNIELISGDFNNYANTKKENFDLVIMCQAFHHFSNPKEILEDVKDLLTPDGSIIIVGEPNHNKFYFFKQIIKNFIKYIINYKKFRSYFSISKIFFGAVLVDTIKGDHHWPIHMYKYFFKRNNFTLIKMSILKRNNTRSFYLKKNV